MARADKPTGGPAPRAGAEPAGAAGPAEPDAADAEAADHPADEPANATAGLTGFAAAIERKKAAGQARSAHLDRGGKIGSATSSRKTSRTFRRKSG